MKVRNAVILAIVLIIAGVLGYVALAGVEFGVREIRPISEQVKPGLDLAGGVTVVLEAQDLSEAELTQKMEDAKAVLRTRLDSLGYAEATVISQGQGRLRLEIPIDPAIPSASLNEIMGSLAQTARVTFRDPDGNILFEGKDMVGVQPSLVADETGQNQYIVQFKLNEAATQIFAEATTRLVGQAISIYIDEEMISSPNVETPITGGEASITGDFDYDSAIMLATQISSGALPIELKQVQLHQVSATLGDGTLSACVTAGIAALCAIFVFMIGYYRLPGLIASLSLAVYLIIIMYLLALVPVVHLTLASIAALMLATLVALGANILVLERMREELRNGKSIGTSVHNGFKNAFLAILDSSVALAVVAIALLLFRTSSLTGFASALLIGIVAAFFSAVFVSRFFMKSLVTFGVRNKSLFCPMPKQKGEEA